MSDDSLFLRLEPARPEGDPERSFTAELADPAWMVGRQWQLGEHQGENASSPVDVRLVRRLVPIEAMVERPGESPAVIPGEALVEGCRQDWWTVGRRARLGRAARRAGVVDALVDGGVDEDKLMFAQLTGPYARLNGIAADGRAVHGHEPGYPVFGEVPTGGDDRWDTETLAYHACFPCGGSELVVGGIDGGPGGRWGGHDGGDVDWWSLDAAGPAVAAGDRKGRRSLQRFPDRFRWPGAPAPRWWQIEDHHVDLGGLAPDRAHLATTMVLDVLSGHADHWFRVPIPARLGHVLHLAALEVTDTFGDTWPWPRPSLAPADGWTLFQVAGLGSSEVPIWGVASAPLVGEVLDEVTIGMDEDANLVWAVEERLGGVATDRRAPGVAPPPAIDDEDRPVAPPPYRYVPTTDVPEHWHPYTREDDDDAMRFVQGRLVEVDGEGQAFRRNPPTSQLLEPAGPGLHRLAPWRIPPTGTHLERRYVLARSTTGQPVLWVQRRRRPLLSVPSSGLRFDALEIDDSDEHR